MRRDSEYEIRIDIYGALIHLWLTDDVQKSHKRFIKKYGDKEDLDSVTDAGGVFLHSVPDDKEYHVIMGRTASAYYVAHECLHVTFQILDTCGVEYDSNNHEAFTYLHGYIVEQVDKRIDKFRKKTKHKRDENL